VNFDYKNFFVDLSAMTNIIPIDAKINTINEGVKSVKENDVFYLILWGGTDKKNQREDIEKAIKIKQFMEANKK
jgi:hypothetical protein